MKKHNTLTALPFLVILAALTLGLPHAFYASTSDEDQRRAERREAVLRAVEEERSRPVPATRGGAVQPRPRTGNSGGIGMAQFRDERVMLVADVYASSIGKEVLVSARVAERRVTMDHVSGDSERIARKIEEAFKAHDITIVEAGEHSVALVD